MKNVLLFGSNLLGALDEKDRQLLKPYLRQVNFREGTILYEPGDDVQFAYFPRHETLVSFLVVMPEGEVVEAALVGREGAVGGIVSHGHLPAFARCCVTRGGDFFRLPSSVLEDLKAQSPAIERLFARYADCLLAQIFQSVACNARHTIEQRTARWLITAMSRTAGNRIKLTQAQLGAFLGVGRSYVARVLGRMREEGIIETQRGGLVVRDPVQLQASACECAKTVQDHFDHVLRGVYPHSTDKLQAPAA